ncbi:hypothetical protein [Mesorhizobium sp. M1348]|uniref:hypothetical protein n=1 Tax=Mesorhizobium sp. M1348 TaxID=2957089 RepID=UPI0033362323
MLEALSRAQALSIQHELVNALSLPVAGWKVAALPDGDLISAPIIRGVFFKARPPFSAVYGLGGVECEIAFCFAREPIRGRNGFASEHIIEAIDRACAAVEVADSRWASKFSIPRNAIVADLLSNGALVIGSLNRNWRDVVFEALGARLGVNGDTACQTSGAVP